MANRGEQMDDLAYGIFAIGLSLACVTFLVGGAVALIYRWFS